jgi:hypothetical protein
MGKAMGMEIVVATRTGEKSALGGYSIPGTGDHEGGESHILDEVLDRSYS